MNAMKKLLSFACAVVAINSVNPSVVLSESFSKSLLEKASSNGSVHVFLRLNVPYQTEGTLPSAQEIKNQRAIITHAQNGLIDRLKGHKLSNIKKFKTIPYMAVEVDVNGLEALLDSADILNIEEDVAVPPTLDESVPFVKADQAHTNGYDGTGWTVAVLDTGVKGTHAFLSGKVISEACYSTTGGGATSLCPGGSNSTALGSGTNCDPVMIPSSMHVVMEPMSLALLREKMAQLFMKALLREQILSQFKYFRDLTIQQTVVLALLHVLEVTHRIKY